MPNELMVSPRLFDQPTSSTSTVDQRLLQLALALTGARSEREVLEMGLRTLVRLHQQDLERIDAEEYSLLNTHGAYLG